MSHLPFEGFDFSDFWEESDSRAYPCKPPTKDLINEVERELGYKLPDSYIHLMKLHNGGIPNKRAFPTTEETSWAEDHVAITWILGIGREKYYTLCGEFGSRFMIEKGGYPNIGVAICDCPSGGHDMIFLDYSECGSNGEPRVVHIDQEYDNKITFLANNFEEFIRGLVPETNFPID